MKKIFIILLLISVFIIIASCGVLMDPYRIQGDWNLDSVSFYEYNAVLDSTKTYSGINADTPDTSHPLNSYFFGYKKNASFSIKFDSSYYNVEEKSYMLLIQMAHDSSTDIIINIGQGRYIVGQYDNSLSIIINGNVDNSSDFWNTRGLGHELTIIKNYWPLPDYQTLELVLTAKDVNKNYFLFDVTNDRQFKITSMKAVFKKQ